MTYNEMEPVNVILTKICDSMIDKMFVPVGMDTGKIGIFVSRKKNAYGYCYLNNNWQISGVPFREIGLTPDGLMRGERAICTTLAHELVHAYNATHEIKDVSGQRHNKKFKEGCDRIGLGCEIKSKSIGWGTDSSFNSEECNAMFDTILSVLSEDERALINDLASILEMPKKKAKNRNLSVFICPCCGAKARAKQSANLICGDCMLPMELNL